MQSIRDYAAGRYPIQYRLLRRRQIKPNGCWEWTGVCHSSGYGQLWMLTPSGKKAWRLVHRIAFMAWVGDIPDDRDVLHSCDNPPCFNPEHLRLGTPEENAIDASMKMRRSITKLSVEDVTEMRRLRTQGVTYREIAERYGVSFAPAYRAINRHTWKWLK